MAGAKQTGDAAQTAQQKTQATPLQVSQLEAALLNQAETQAREQRQTAELAKARILQEAADKLKLAEDREVMAAKAEAERRVRHKVQATQTRLATELDRLRWSLTEATLSEVRLAFQKLVQDENAYMNVLAQWLAVADQELPPGDLLVEVRPADQTALQKHWDVFLSQVKSGRKTEMVVHDKVSEGGICVRLSNNQARMDQTFEARQSRLADELARVVMTHLFAETGR